MKKMISLLLALVMVLSLSVTAFASEITQPSNNSQNVTGTYVAGEEAQTIYSVDISWGDMKFTYTGASADVWNPGDHSTTPGAAAAWTVDTVATETTLAGNEVKVTNHSNAAVTATVTYASLDAYSAITGTVTGGEMELASAVGTEYASAPNSTASLALAGELPSTHTEGAQIGTITVTIGGGQTSLEYTSVTLTFKDTVEAPSVSAYIFKEFKSVTFYDANGGVLVTSTDNPAAVPVGAVTFTYTYNERGQSAEGEIHYEQEYTSASIVVPTASSTINIGESTTTPNA